MMDKRLTVRPGRSLPTVRVPRKEIVTSPHEYYSTRVITAIEEMSNADPQWYMPLDKARNNIPKYSDDFLKIAASELAGEAEDLHAIATDLVNSKPEKEMLMNFAFNDLLEGMHYRRATDHALSLATYQNPNVPPSPLTAEEILPEHIALIKVTHAMMERDTVDNPFGRVESTHDPLMHCSVSSVYTVKRIKHYALIDLVLEYADDVSLMTTIITHTGITDSDTLRELIDTVLKHPAGIQKACEALDSGKVTRAVELEAILSGTSGVALAEGIL